MYTSGKQARSRICAFSILALFFVPVLLGAASHESSIIPCDGPECGFNDVIRLIQNLMNFIITISIPIAALAFAYSGILFMTSGGSEDKRKRGKDIFTNVAIGFFFIVAAWLIVALITTALLDKSFYEEFVDF